jgi:hypothetical protein
MTIQHPLQHRILPPSTALLEALWQAIETEDEHVFLAASEDGTIEAVLPEWSRMKGAFNTQHRNHDFTLDVHTAKVVVKTRTSPYFQSLSPHWKRLTTVAALLHDISKDAGAATERQTISPDALHPLKGAAVARRVLPLWGFSPMDTFCVAALIRYHQLFGHMIIRHNKLGHPPTIETLLEQALLFPDVQFLAALLPLTEGDIRAVKANDSIFDADVERKLFDYSMGVHACIKAIRQDIPTYPRKVYTDEATQLALCYGILPPETIQHHGGTCECGLENMDTPLRFEWIPSAKTSANAYGFVAFTEHDEETLVWKVRNPFIV